MPGQASAKRSRIKKAQAKKAAQKEAKKAGSTAAPLIVPTVTEDDLLAFQFSHLGDNTKPETWYVDAETAITFEPEIDDGLGYYEDGEKRTLTDEQIEMFRHSEKELLMREQKREQEERDAEAGETTIAAAKDDEQQTGSPMSEALRRQSEAVDSTASPSLAPPTQSAGRKQSQSSRSDSSSRTGLMKRQRHHEVPYDERHKRKWEHYIEENDSTHGSMTHRRIVRELDEQRVESVDLDY